MVRDKLGAPTRTVHLSSPTCIVQLTPNFLQCQDCTENSATTFISSMLDRELENITSACNVPRFPITFPLDYVKFCEPVGTF